MLEEIRRKIDNAIFTLQITRGLEAKQLVVNCKVYENIKSYIGVVEEGGFKEYFNGLEVIVDNSVKELKVR